MQSFHLKQTQVLPLAAGIHSCRHVGADSEDAQQTCSGAQPSPAAPCHNRPWQVSQESGPIHIARLPELKLMSQYLWTIFELTLMESVQSQNWTMFDHIV